MLRFIDGFDQFQSQAGATLLASLVAAGYVTSQGLAMAAGRHTGTHALELQVTAGAGGASWSRRTNNLKADLNSVAVNPTGRWTAVGIGGAMAYSIDTINWTPLTSGTPNDLSGIAHGGALWVAVGAAGTILTAPDGQTWTSRICPVPTASLAAVAYGNGRWVIVGANGTAGVILTSTDGITWSVITENAGATGNLCVRYGDVWMVGGNGGQVLTSEDGLTWTNRNFGATTAVSGLAFDGSAWLSATGQNVRRSANAGATWTQAAAQPIQNQTLRDIAHSDGRWVIVTSGGQLATSNDGGLTWEKRTLSGSSSQAINRVVVSAGAAAAWVAVGNRIGGSTGTPFIYVSAAPPTTIRRTFTSTSNRVVIGFAHRATARGRILSIAGLLDMEWPAGIEILGQAGASVPIRNAWYYYELVIDKAAKTVSLFVNDTADLMVALPVGKETMSEFVVTWQSENGAVTRLDDLYFLDSDSTGGSTLTSRLKPIRVPVRLPTSDVTANWDGSVASQHWPLIGLLPPSASSFIRSSTSGAQDLFRSSNPLPEGAGTPEMPVIAVGVIALAQKSDLDNRQLGLVVGEGVGQVEVLDPVLSMTPEYSTAVFEKAPGGQAWTAANVTDTPFGVVVRP
jgi:hypothetical protein